MKAVGNETRKVTSTDLDDGIVFQDVLIWYLNKVGTKTSFPREDRL